MFTGEPLIVDRKTGVPPTIYVPSPLVSICGGIQPGILHKVLGSEHRESGLAARLLMAMPPRRAKQWTECDVDPAVAEAFEAILERLFGELKLENPGDGEWKPHVVNLTPEARDVFVSFYDRHNAEQIETQGEIAAAFSKLEEYAARLALIVHCARWAACDPTLASFDAVDAASMEAGVTLAEWFKREAVRVYGQISESDGDGKRRKLVEWVERKGKPVTARDVYTGCRRWISDSTAAEAALADLVQAGYGVWEMTRKGQSGRPTRRFRLISESPVSETPANKPGKQGFC